MTLQELEQELHACQSCPHLEAARERTLQLAPDCQLMSEEKTDLFKLFKKRVNDYL